MKSRNYALLLMLTLLLASCQASQTPEATSGPSTVIDGAQENGAASTQSEDGPENNGADTGPDFVTLAPGQPMSGCTLQTLIRPPDENERSLFKPISESDWKVGAENAAVTIVHYADFQCPACAQLSKVLNQLKANFPEEVAVVFRQYPQMDTSDKAVQTVSGTEAAGAQGKFWEMHDLLFARQHDWANLAAQDFAAWLTDRAGELGLDPDAFSSAMEDPAYTDRAKAAFDEGFELGIPGTPFLLINGRIYDGPTDYDNLSIIVKLFALQEMQYTGCPPVIIDLERNYLATIETEKGPIVIELFPSLAPRAVNNFIFLANNGWYNGITFHRVLPGYIAQAGDPSGTGFGGPGYAFINENPDSIFDTSGLVAMANSGPDTNGSQFFITFAPAPALNGSYTIFGRVIEGMGVAQALTLRDPAQGINLPPGDKIITVTIEEK